MSIEPAKDSPELRETDTWALMLAPFDRLGREAESATRSFDQLNHAADQDGGEQE